MRWMWLLILAVGLASCGYRINTISADRDVIVLKSSIRNPGPVAQAHCAQYGRTARLQTTDQAKPSIYYFVCLDR